ncbi:MAG: hypothetical protein Kow0096_19280 [Thiohalomonadaceae bacterium]
MLKLARSLAAWGTPEFASVVKAEIEGLDGNLLPLQAGLVRTSYAITEGFTAILLDVAERADVLRVKVGISYRGIIPGCSCADDPTPIDEVPEYCVVQFDIDRKTAVATASLLDGE